MAEKSVESASPTTPIKSDNPYRLNLQDSLELYGELRKCPVRRSDALGGFYWLTRHDDVRAAAQDWERFSSARKGVMLPANPSAERLPALEMDPPDHAPWRMLYMEALTPDRLRAVEPRLVAIANRLIDAFAGAGECDLMKTLAEPMPVLGVCETIGLAGASVERVREAADEFGRSAAHPKRRESAIQKIGANILSELLARRAEPRDDYLTRVANAEVGGRKMSEAELAGFMVGFLVAGHETTTSAMGTLLFHVLSRPELKERMLADDRLISAAIEEAVRLYPPFQGFHRTTTEPVTVGDVTVPADATVRLCYAAANRDPDAYERPDEFDPDRPSKPHMGFGFGRHVCLGAPLARLEMRTAIKELLRRLPDIRLVDTDLEFNLMGGTFLMPKSCRVEFTPQPPGA